MSEESPRVDRATMTALAAAPLGLALAVVVVLLAAAAGRDPFWAATPLTLAEAAAIGDGGAVVRLMAAGADPSAPASVRAGVLKPEALRLTPLQAAVAARRTDMVELLVQEGARVGEESAASLICFAERLNLSELSQRLQAVAGLHQAPDCAGVVTPW